MTPLNELEGVATADSAELIAPCTKGGETIELASDVLLPSAAEQENPKTRLAMARVLVDMTNHALERFGCSEPALPLPKDLPPIPDTAPPLPEEEMDSDESCPGAYPVPGYDPVEDARTWTVRTPQPSKMLSVCEVRTVDSNSSDPLVMLVTYKNTLAKAYQESSEHAMPRYDTTCHGTPISYRVYVADPGGDYQDELPGGPEYQQLLEDMASAAAQRNGCPLPEG